MEVEVIVAIVAAFVAAVAAGISSWQAVSAREQAKSARVQATAAELQALEAVRASDAAEANLRLVERQLHVAEMERRASHMQGARESFHIFYDKIKDYTGGVNHIVLIFRNDHWSRAGGPIIEQAHALVALHQEIVQTAIGFAQSIPNERSDLVMAAERLLAEVQPLHEHLTKVLLGVLHDRAEEAAPAIAEMAKQVPKAREAQLAFYSLMANYLVQPYR
ncbi:hypothetical protein ACQPWY_03460 [Pseudonocardia xinjiangensis]|uniref:hypothetical protein n=1 Tax=Pseudonocardia xinjiangensis TaxID=75289 RepID=UPI003D8CA88B